MVYNERKRQSFEFFATRQWVEVPVYAAAVGMYPIRSSYRYLKKLHKYNYLWRGHDFRGVSSTGFRRGVQGGFFGANRLGLLSHGQTEAETLDNTLYLFRDHEKAWAGSRERVSSVEAELFS